MLFQLTSRGLADRSLLRESVRGTFWTSYFIVTEQNGFLITYLRDPPYFRITYFVSVVVSPRLHSRREAVVPMSGRIRRSVLSAVRHFRNIPREVSQGRLQSKGLYSPGFKRCTCKLQRLTAPTWAGLWASVLQMISRCYATTICNTQTGILNSTIINEDVLTETTTRVCS